jgi:phenylpyruvate tautomerase PptA (4-oxalocrotonate tautomerase family)
MPIVTITVRKPKTAEFKSKVLEAVHVALVGIGVHPQDRFHRVLELEPDAFQYDPTFPDARTPRDEDFVLVEILLGVGRSTKVKRALLAALMEQLSSHGLNPENVMVVFQDVPWENWSPAGGRIRHA